MSRTTDENVDALKQTADRVRDKAAEVSQHLKDAATEKYDEVREHVRTRATDAYNQGRETAEQWEQSLESYVQDKPLQAVLLAAGVGLLLGLLWKRR